MKKKKSKFNRLQIEVFFLPKNPKFKSPEYRPIYKPIKFVLCPYIRPGRITEILGYIYIYTYIHIYI